MSSQSLSTTTPRKSRCACARACVCLCVGPPAAHARALAGKHSPPASPTPPPTHPLRQAFYMRMNEDGKTVAAMDVLVPKVRGAAPGLCVCVRMCMCVPEGGAMDVLVPAVRGGEHLSCVCEHAHVHWGGGGGGGVPTCARPAIPPLLPPLTHTHPARWGS